LPLQNVDLSHHGVTGPVRWPWIRL
jgi:hypothetical protein